MTRLDLNSRVTLSMWWLVCWCLLAVCRLLAVLEGHKLLRETLRKTSPALSFSDPLEQLHLHTIPISAKVPWSSALFPGQRKERR